MYNFTICESLSFYFHNNSFSVTNYMALPDRLCHSFLDAHRPSLFACLLILSRCKDAIWLPQKLPQRRNKHGLIFISSAYCAHHKSAKCFFFSCMIKVLSNHLKNRNVQKASSQQLMTSDVQTVNDRVQLKMVNQRDWEPSACR